MIRQSFNEDWQFTKMQSQTLAASFAGAAQSAACIDLPHDAMLHEQRTPDTPNGAQTGFYPGGQYLYTKRFDVPEGWQDKTAILELGGVYQTAMVYVNGALAAQSLHGYTGFTVCLDPYISYGAANEVKVIADNTAVPNSRWYTGAGIYREVNLLLGARVHIQADGVRLRTVAASEKSALLEIETMLCNRTPHRQSVHLRSALEIDGGTAAEDGVPVTLYPQEKTVVRQRICLENPQLWSCDSPAMYRCSSTLVCGGEVMDESRESFGIRTFSIDAKNGLLLNGKSVKLRGTCLHHDNGILGAAAFADAEERKCRLLKQAGFNSVRSAHNPMGRAMLDACDRYGLLVMDELSDVWGYHKNPHDYALHFAQNWQTEVERMVAKDYNHPCVILYSTGNEIQELGTCHGAHLNREISNKFHQLDAARYTTAGLNGLMALAFNGKMQEVMRQLAAQLLPPSAPGAGSDAGANAINTIMGSIMSGEGADAFACHPTLTASIEESETATDVIGLNYLTGRHVLEKQLHPNKAVLGAETYPADIARLWGLVEDYPHIIGDFTWTGYDYLGEAGCGIFHYDGGVNFSSIWPERLAYIGDIDLVGCRRPISYYREIVYGLRKEPYIAVERLNRYGQTPGKTAWMFKDNIASWTWPGFEGKPAVVEVYADAQEVELLLNGKSLGRKPAGRAQQYTARYELGYAPGTLEAVSYNDGQPCGRFALKTAGQQASLTAQADKPALAADGSALAFITIGFADEYGTENPAVQDTVTVEVEGAGILQALGSANPASEESYDAASCSTFDGKLLAVIRSNKAPGQTRVTLRSEKHGACQITLQPPAQG